MHPNIHTTVLKRLLLSWLILTLVIGGIVFYIEMEKVDDFVRDLAVKESKALTADLDPTDPTHVATLRNKSAEFLKSHFIVIELYDADKRKILEVTDPGKESIEEQLKGYVHSFPLEDAVHYNKFWLDGRVYMQVLVPLQEAAKTLGYFEGVYEVDADSLDRIRAETTRILILVVIITLATTIILYPVIISLNRGLVRLSKDLLKGNIELMEVLGSAIAKRDSDTAVHNYRVTIYAIRLAEALNLAEEPIRRLIAGAFLHDVGKIGISDNILLKPGKLTDEEFQVMRTHVLLGEDIIKKSNWLQSARDVVEFHHEKFDGSGYMRGLKGEDIPLNARIFAIVDVFDALTSKRPYKEPMDFDQAMAIIQRDSGSHFDPRLVAAFAEIARPLHETVSALPNAEVEQLLNSLVIKHFF